MLGDSPQSIDRNFVMASNHQNREPAMQAYFGERRRERAHFDRACAILDSNSEKAWRETKMRPREWELG